ncbi:MAG TPA: phosphohydrolase, partial [Verrucomicrobium sp.]|nr:phosphohydrolase [Verrucomicrobium sp.]
MKSWQNILKASNEEIVRWAAVSDWAAAMRECQQDAIWHAEGDVWTHTMMVCEEVQKLAGYEELSRE